MHLDRLALELGESLRDRGIECILLRGASIARHLYSPGELRRYTDADLLVPARQRESAEALLVEQGFCLRDQVGRTLGDRPAWARMWHRASDSSYVDLHRTVVGAGVEPMATWAVLREHVEPVDVSDRTLNGLDLPATAAVVALHAAQHGREMRRTLDDLSRALERVPLETWREAARVAERLDALPAFAAGLRLDPAGAEVAGRLGLPSETSAEIVLRAATAPPTSLGFDWLARKQGVAAKTVYLAGKAVPPVDFMREWSPLARRGRLGLALAYCWRPIWLVRHGIPGLRAWRAATRRAHP
jgi:hypothetical protein